MRFRLVLFILIFFLLLLFPTNSLASDEFSTSYNITYNVNSDGLTRTRQVITLTNKLDHIFATQYQVIIGSTTIENIEASDNFGEIKPEIKTNENSTTILMNFDKKIIGEGKSRIIILTYQTKDFATIKGKVLEVGFPLLANSEELTDYQVTVTIPSSFGDATQIIPPDYEIIINPQITSYTFLKNHLKGYKGITATFGTQQIYNFNFKYHLENKNAYKGKTEIALPPDTNYQDVIYDEINPRPENVIQDTDGNWLAEYVVQPLSTMTITAKGKIQLSYFPKKTYARALTEKEKQHYTKADIYWESDHQNIKDIAKQLGTPQAIYDFIVSNFIYDYGRLKTNPERLGALKALADKDSAICMEFTDAFIAIARAAGIPAREHNGYAYTENDKLRPLSFNQDVLHAWPEFYDTNTQQWHQIDPTWENTTGGLDFFNKFDLDHITFVTHGLESNYPIPVGSYKTTDSETKDVLITFGTDFNPKQAITISISPLPSGITGLPVKGTIKVKNTGNSALYNLPITVNLKKQNTDILNKITTLNTLPPFAYVDIPFSFSTNWQQEGGNYTLTVLGFGESAKQTFTLKQLVNIQVLILVGGSSFGLLLWLIGFNLFKKSKQNLLEDAGKSIPPLEPTQISQPKQ